jgi:pilus assembly protein CpaC
MSTKRPIDLVRLNVEGVVRVAPAAGDTTSVILTGVTAGSVRLTMRDIDGKEEHFDIVVQLDVAYLKRIIADTVPTAKVDVRPVLNRGIILSGWVAKAEDVDVILNISRQALPGLQVINAMQVGGVMQVQLDVTVASVSRTEARRRGFSYAINGNTISTGSLIGGLTSNGGQQQQAQQGGGVGLLPFGQPFQPSGTGNLVLGIVPGQVQMLIQALRDENLAKLLAEPKLVTLSGRPARFLAGGQQAVVGPSSGVNGPGVVYRDIGTELDFLPIVLGNGRIYLEVSPVVRSVNNARGIVFQGSLVPGFDEQSVRTAVELEPGQTMAIGGLIQTTVQGTASRVPWLGDLPFIGGFFNSVQYTEQETELVVLVTPHLVDGQDCKQAPKRLPGRETRSPDDYELFLEYLLEAPRGQREVFEGGKYKPAYKNDSTAQQYPCAEPLPKEPRGRRRGADCVDNCPPNTTPSHMGAPATINGVGDSRIPPTAVETLPTPGAPRFGASSSRSLPRPVTPPQQEE